MHMLVDKDLCIYKQIISLVVGLFFIFYSETSIDYLCSHQLLTQEKKTDFSNSCDKQNTGSTAFEIIG